MMIEAMVANERTKMLTLSPARRVSAKWKWWQWSGRYGPNLLHVLESTQTLMLMHLIFVNIEGPVRLQNCHFKMGIHQHFIPSM